MNVNKYEKDAEKKNISIIQQNESNDTLTALDETYISKCFAYIMNNAIKYGNNDSQIHIKIATINKNIVVTIEDEGKQFPEGYDLSDIQPFNTKSHIDQNPALSLYLCKRIIEAHNGQIQIMNTENGAIVTVSIPKATIDI
jgi:K+-sensing histidine kinase KdpD